MSYKDSNGDGVGDIQGLISTLPYLQSLGIDIVWLSPMYASPQKDYGYDISNYEDIYPPFGTLSDMEQLVKECHDRGMKLLLDLVINHTSDQHKWFLESRSSKDNEYSDWYIWKDPKYVDGVRHPPNNWRAIFGGPAWEYVSERDQYYLHLFVPEQPDLNWENEVTRKGIYKSAISFWLDRGVDGFRVDTVNLYSKDTSYPDAPITLPNEVAQPAFQFFTNGPRMHEWLREIRKDVLDKYGDVAMVGELPTTPAPEVLKYVSAAARELSCVFDFEVVSLGGRHNGEVKKHEVWKHALPDFKEAWRKTQDLLVGTDAWTTVFAENHDQGRSLSRFATDQPRYREKAAKLLAMLLCTLSGSLFMYQGQEIGMVNIPAHWGPEELRDVDSLNYWRYMEEMYGGDAIMRRKAMSGIRKVGRDNARTPVQWDGGESAGFTSGRPWIRVHDNYKEINVAAQEKDPNSPLNFWKKMLKLRKGNPELMIEGEFKIWDIRNLETFTYTKEKDGRKLLVVLNMNDGEEYFDIPTDIEGKTLKLLVANVETLGGTLSPWEARTYLVV
jgi:oligo-1,6-glucosidase